MKANEAPEKLYLGSKQRPDKEIFYVFTTPVENDDIEYIRVDTFIEKVRKYIANHFLAPGMDNEVNDFVNYMKGE